MRPTTLLFDINETLLDIREVRESVGRVLGGSQEAAALWFTTMLQYSLVATVGSSYEDFDKIGVATLHMLAKRAGIELEEDAAMDALRPILSAPPHPEVPSALRTLKDRGFTIVALANSTGNALHTQLSNAGLLELFDKELSIQELGLYKPHRAVYEWAAHRMGVPAGECMLVAAHGWDIAGALWAGMRAAFVARTGQQLYPLAPQPEIIADDVEGVVQALLADT